MNIWKSIQESSNKWNDLNFVQQPFLKLLF
jgi:hypothetical protein